MSNKITEWEVGQDLIHCYDEIVEKIQGMKGSQFKDQIEVLIEAADQIAKVFNKKHTESHCFGLGRMKVEFNIPHASVREFAEKLPTVEARNKENV